MGKHHPPVTVFETLTYRDSADGGAVRAALRDAARRIITYSHELQRSDLVMRFSHLGKDAIEMSIMSEEPCTKSIRDTNTAGENAQNYAPVADDDAYYPGGANDDD